MAERVIPLVDQRLDARQPFFSQQPMPPSGLLSDARGRTLHDLRISVTDRCNFRCSYCMPKEIFNSHHPYLPHGDLLTFEEITRLARLFVHLGVRKIRLTGGEPLLRKNLEILVEQLAQIRSPDGGPLDLTLTTNGSLLQRKARALKDAGLKRVTISLDGLDDAVFKRMNDVDFPVTDVLDGIEAALAVGLGVDDHGHPSGLKVNMVVKRGTNDNQIAPMARHFRGSGMALRFIEYMDVGNTNGWRMAEVMPSAQVLDTLRQVGPLIQLSAQQPGETAQRWGWAGADGQHDPALGEIGLISSVTEAFCGDCNRARLSTEGKLYLCLFAHQGYDLRAMLRDGSSDERLLSAVAGTWTQRDDRYSEMRAQGVAPSEFPRVEMSYIGG
ncbi:MAG: GTP 3',8-cyclase MoaA [Alphaproteobacteria bacterium]|nr:GTP 3',8-cyclase MoaA [Alphaproteobacteria bacterium]